EALRFALAKPLSWTALELHEGGQHTVRVGYVRPDLKTVQWPPAVQGFLERRAYTWLLFTKYLAFVLPHGKETVHPCTFHLPSVMKASGISIEAEALALGVAVEGLTKCLFPDLGQPSDALKKAVDAIGKHALKWEGFVGPPEVVKLRERLSGHLGNLKKQG